MAVAVLVLLLMIGVGGGVDIDYSAWIAFCYVLSLCFFFLAAAILYCGWRGGSPDSVS